MTIITEVENDDGTVSEHRVTGVLGAIYRRQSSFVIKPHYGNSTLSEATQVEVHVDAMIVPSTEFPEPLLRITEIDPGDRSRALPQQAPPSALETIVMKEVLP